MMVKRMIEWPCNNCNDNPYDSFDTRSCPYYDNCKKIKEFEDELKRIREEKGIQWCLDCKHYDKKEMYCLEIDCIVDRCRRKKDTKCLFFEKK